MGFLSAVDDGARCRRGVPAGIPGGLRVRIAASPVGRSCPLRRRDPSGLGIGEVVRRRSVLCGQRTDEHGVIGRPDPGDAATLSGQPVTPDRSHVISTAGASPVTDTIRARAAVPSPRIHHQPGPVIGPLTLPAVGRIARPGRPSADPAAAIRRNDVPLQRAQPFADAATRPYLMASPVGDQDASNTSVSCEGSTIVRSVLRSRGIDGVDAARGGAGRLGHDEDLATVGRSVARGIDPPGLPDSESRWAWARGIRQRRAR